jgi:hypothetical protein
MSVPKWRQTVSKTQYLNLLYELNIKMGHILLMLLMVIVD